MASNSLCFAPKMKYETWFMEGRLKPGVHYVEIQPDGSDLAEKIDFYNQNPQKAKDIIKQANLWCEPFKNKKLERLIGLKVMHKYFQLTGQIA